MARTDILVEAIPGESRIAIVEDGRLAELIVARAGGGSLVGNVYLGRVVRVVPAIEAAFVDIGRRDDVFLGDKDVRRLAPDEVVSISDLVHEGEAVTVQVTRDAFADKSAKVSARITLPGRYLVYRPTESGVVVSRKIAETDDAREARAWKGLL